MRSSRKYVLGRSHLLACSAIVVSQDKLGVRTRNEEVASYSSSFVVESRGREDAAVYLIRHAEPYAVSHYVAKCDPPLSAKPFQEGTSANFPVIFRRGSRQFPPCHVNARAGWRGDY